MEARHVVVICLWFDACASCRLHKDFHSKAIGQWPKKEAWLDKPNPCLHVVDMVKLLSRID